VLVGIAPGHSRRDVALARCTVERGVIAVLLLRLFHCSGEYNAIEKRPYRRVLAGADLMSLCGMVWWNQLEAIRARLYPMAFGMRA
jgi:hypothetical protein